MTINSRVTVVCEVLPNTGFLVGKQGIVKRERARSVDVLLDGDTEVVLFFRRELEVVDTPTDVV